MNGIPYALRWLWALPLSLPGLVLWAWLRWRFGHSYAGIAGAPLCPVFYAFGPGAARLLRTYPFVQVQALTIGCVVLACDEQTLHDTWTHELVHVKQGLSWGPLFALLYALSSAWAWLKGADPYHDNIFEREAYAIEALAQLGTSAQAASTAQRQMLQTLAAWRLNTHKLP